MISSSGAEDVFQWSVILRPTLYQPALCYKVTTPINLYFLAALLAIWCLFRLCFFANFIFFRNLGSQPDNENNWWDGTAPTIRTHPSYSCAFWVRASSDRSCGPYGTGYEPCDSLTLPWRSRSLKQVEMVRSVSQLSQTMTKFLSYFNVSDRSG